MHFCKTNFWQSSLQSCLIFQGMNGVVALFYSDVCVLISFCICVAFLLGLPYCNFQVRHSVDKWDKPAQNQFICRAVWKIAWYSIVSVSRTSRNLAAVWCFGSPLALAGAPPPDWWSCLFLITSEIKYHAREFKIGTKNSVAPVAGTTAEFG